MTASAADPPVSRHTAEASEALQVTVTAPIVSFRNPLYSSVALCLPCPPPATVGGLLAAVAGGWEQVDPDLRFAMAFTADATGGDLETFHPLEQQGKRTDPVPRERHFLAGATLTIWLADDVELWRARFRRPVWPLRLGRSQDLASARTEVITLRRGSGQVGGALLPADAPTGGTLLQLPTAISRDRSRVRWEPYRHHRSVGSGLLGPGAALRSTLEGWVAPDGRAVRFLPSAHPATVEAA